MSDNTSFAEQYLSSSHEPPIRHQAVRRIAFEGGGGKGNAYLGALFALEQLGVLGRLETVAGSSAGAITALALSLGMKPADVFGFMSTTDFSSFFDAESDVTPVPGRPYARPSKQEQQERRRVKAAWAGALAPLEAVRAITGAVRRAASGVSTTIARGLMETLYRAQDVQYAFAVMRLGPAAGPRPARSGPVQAAPPQDLPAKVTDQLLSALPPYLTSLSYDMGVFSGEAARERLAALIAERVAAVVQGATGRPVVVDGRTVTFGELDSFSRRFGFPLLRVTGSEMCALKSIVFSGDTTPAFPVADAVRISMGLPFVYKPYTLRSSGQGLPPCGVYVDGGVFANLPMLAFSDREAADAIGLRLEIDVPTRIDGFLGMLGQVAQASLLAGESSVINERERRSIRLDTLPLGLFDFSSDRTVLETVSARAHLTTMLFFGQGAGYRPVNLTTGEALPAADAARVRQETWKDLEASVQRRRAAGACVFNGQK